jgi:hypothetical protein
MSSWVNLRRSVSLNFFNPFFEVTGEFGKECGCILFAGEHFLVFFGVVAQLLLNCKLKSFDNVFQCGSSKITPCIISYTFCYKIIRLKSKQVQR